MFLVTGGETVSDTLGSTEIYDPEIGSWSEVPPLPSPRSSLRAASLGNRVLIFGIDIYCKHKVSLINTFDNLIVNSCMDLVCLSTTPCVTLGTNS